MAKTKGSGAPQPNRAQRRANGVKRRPEFAGNRQRYRMEGDAPPPLQFGQHGELTAKTIAQANLTPEEEKRAREMLRVQSAFLQILDCLSSYPIDPDGNVHDLSALGPTKTAIAWTLALAGFRPSGTAYIKQRALDVDGVVKGAKTWVDARSADDAAKDLKPEHKSSDYKLPPDTRRLAAIRDGDAPMQMPEVWATKPEIVWLDEERPEGWDDKIKKAQEST